MKPTLRKPTSWPLPRRMEKVHAEKPPSVLVPKGIQLAPKQKENSQHDLTPPKLERNSTYWKQYRYF